MSDLEAQIRAEIDEVEREMEDQKRLIRRSLDNAQVVLSAETELKALHTRMVRLTGNLQKEQQTVKEFGSQQ
jgi:phage shock protein A